MPVSTYMMYMDESETKKSDEQRYFVIGGLIIKNEDYTAIEKSLIDLKNLLWAGDANASSYILHEKDVSLLLRGQIAIILMKFHLITKFSQRKAMS